MWACYPKADEKIRTNGPNVRRAFLTPPPPPATVFILGEVPDHWQLWLYPSSPAEPRTQDHLIPSQPSWLTEMPLCLLILWGRHHSDPHVCDELPFWRRHFNWTAIIWNSQEATETLIGSYFSTARYRSPILNSSRLKRGFHLLTDSAPTSMINGEIFALLPILWPQVTRSGINMEYWLDQSEASPGLFTWGRESLSLAPGQKLGGVWCKAAQGSCVWLWGGGLSEKNQLA